MERRTPEKTWLRDALSGVALLSVLSGGCSDQRPLAPSPIASRPQLDGSYTLTLTPCELPDGNQVASISPVGPYRSIWTFTQQDDVITGRYSLSSGPAVSYGTLTARVGVSGEVFVESLRYSWSSSHVGLLQFSASGGGVADNTQISGTVSGDNSFNTIFIGGSLSTCSGTRMPFTFTRSSTVAG